jgi:hypothetical protein
VTQLHDIARQLVLAAPAGSLFGDWPLEVRHGVVAALERAFLDPGRVLVEGGHPPTFARLRTRAGRAEYAALFAARPNDVAVATAYHTLSGKANAFDSVFDVDWVVDLDALAEGEPEKAVNAHQATYSWQSADPAAQSAAHASHTAMTRIVKDDNLISYRNYLRSIFTGPSSSSDFQERVQLLETRFHQDFGVQQCAEAPANGVLIPIIKNILRAPPNSGYGFGVQSGDIPAQGSKSDRSYLLQLIGLSGLSSQEFGLRYRLDLDRPDSATSSPVEENISTLQRFYSDGFESDPDPFPLTELEHAPFYLEYEEWLSSRKFFPENLLMLRSTFTFGSTLSEKERETIAEENTTYTPLTQWFNEVLRVSDMLADAYKAFDVGQYRAARSKLLEARSLAGSLVGDPNDPRVQSKLDELLAMPVTDLHGLEELTEFLAYRDPDLDAAEPDEGSVATGPGGDLDLFFGRFHLSLLHAYLYVIPAHLAEANARLGNYPEAMLEWGRTTGVLIARATPTDPAGDLTKTAFQERPYVRGPLPYSVELGPESTMDGPPASTEAFVIDPDPGAWLQKDPVALAIVPERTHPVERRHLRLRHGAAILDWADSLYRTGDSSSVARARELYKATLFLHGRAPPIQPSWNDPGGLAAEATSLLAGHMTVTPHDENPAVESQTARATAALLQIEAGLNYYGADDRLVPAQRYTTLKAAADRFAASAKTAQQDFLTATEHIEESVREGVIATNMLQRAQIQAEIAEEQRALAEWTVAQAQRQVEQIKGAIEAKKAEIEDHDSFGTAFVDWATGFKSNLDALPKSLGAEKAASAFDTGGGAAGGAAAGSGGAFAGAGVAAAWLAVGYSAAQSLVSWSDAQDQREQELGTLERDALPWAEAQVVAMQHNVTVAELQRKVAESDAQLARNLLRFEAERLLNAEFWAAVASVMQRVMRRYLDLGARFAWLAERALAYEQDRSLRIIRFDYFPATLSGVTGADLLQSDLAELETARLDALRETVPVARMYSLAMDFPLAFASLKATGTCSFMTVESDFRVAHPGIYAPRIERVRLVVQSFVPGSMRGLLGNLGVSSISRSDGSQHISVRPRDALPLSKDGLAVGDAGETLRSFEGSGVETFWTLTLPSAANPYGVDQVSDVLMTIEGRASWSPELHELHLSSMPSTVRRSVLVSALAQNPEAMEQFSGGSGNTLQFDMSRTLLPSSESERTVINLVLFLVGSTQSLAATLLSTNPPVEASLVFDQGIAASNASPLSNGAAPSPLNQFVGQGLDQVFELALDTPGETEPGEVTDVVLLVEYEAQLTG